MASGPDPRRQSVDWGKRWRNDRLYTDQVFWGLVAVNVIVYVMWQLDELFPFMLTHFRVSLAGVLDGRVWTLLSAAFSHREPWHLLFNLFGIYVFGRAIGEVRGARELLLVYVAGALVASVAHVLFSALVPELARPALGASGGVMALAAYFGGMFPDRTLLVGFLIPMPAALAVGLFILLDIFMLGSTNSTVAHAAHLGGAAYGLLHYQLFVQARR